HTLGLIHDTVADQKDNIPNDDIITKKFQRLTQELFMGEQYDWLARFAEAYHLNDLELSIHHDDKASFFVKNNSEKIILESGDEYYTLKKDLYDTDYDIFSYYHFPLMELTKKDMEENAKQNGFNDIME